MSEITILGIDLGTTKSAIAIWSAQTAQAALVRSRAGERLLIPSVVAFDPRDGAPTVGAEALARQADAPEQVVAAVKRFIGRTFRDEWVRYDQQHMTYAIEEAPDRRVLIRVAERRLTPPQVSAEVLGRLKRDAAAALGVEVAEAIVTVPAYFNESQRQATREAGELAGLHIRRIINEPTAAALAYGLGASSQTVAVYDLGGGTFDISILQIDRGLFRVRATDGDTHLGSGDFDIAVVGWLAEEFARQHGAALPVAREARLRARLLRAAEQAKVALSTAEQAPIELAGLVAEDGRLYDLRLSLTRATLERLIRPLVDRTLAICDRVLESARVGREEISQVLLVGSPTRTPAIAAAVKAHFGCPVNTSVPPEEAVARGAAMLGARLCGHLREQVKLWDVTPLTLGVELASGQLDPIIAANKAIPISVSHRFTTQRDRQQRILLRIYQGERPTAADNALLGELVLNLTTSRLAGEAHIDCTFMVDHDGILHVSAVDADTEGQPVEATFDRLYHMSAAEVEQLRAQAERHRAEDAVAARLFVLRDELEQLHRAVARHAAPGQPLRVRLDELDAAIKARDADRAEQLLGQLQAAMSDE